MLCRNASILYKILKLQVKERVYNVGHKRTVTFKKAE